MKIRISSPFGVPITILDDLVSFEYQKNLSDVGLAKFAVSYKNEKITKESVSLFNVVEYLYTDDMNVLWTVRKGIISDISVSPAGISISCIDRIGVMQYRLLRNTLNLTTSTINAAINTLTGSINGAFALPFAVVAGYAGPETRTLAINPGTTMLDAFRQAIDGATFFRSLPDRVEVGISTNLGGNRRYNANNIANANIVDRGWVVSIKDFWNAVISREKSTNTYQMTDDIASMAKYGAVIERFANRAIGATETLQPDPTKMPTIIIDAYKEKWRSLEVGDTKGVSLITELDYLDLSLEANIASISVSGGGGMYNVSISVSTENQKNRAGIGQVLQKMSISIARQETM